jgi:hypothetical protein
MRHPSLAARFSHWQIIELQPSDTPGEFVAWVMTSRNQMQRLRLAVPRMAYVAVKQIEASTHAVAKTTAKTPCQIIWYRLTGSKLFLMKLPVTEAND